MSSHSFKAVATLFSSPIRFEIFTSKVSDVSLANLSCSEAMFRARASNAGEKEPWLAALTLVIASRGRELNKQVLEKRNSRRLPGFRYVFIHRRQIQGAANILDHCFYKSLLNLPSRRILEF